MVPNGGFFLSNFFEVQKAKVEVFEYRSCIYLIYSEHATHQDCRIFHRGHHRNHKKMGCSTMMVGTRDKNQ